MSHNDDATNFILAFVFGLISIGGVLACCCYCCCCRGRTRRATKRSRSKEVNCLCLLICLPFLPIIWLFYLYRRYKRTVIRKVTYFFTVRRPETNRLDAPITHSERKRGNEGFSWFVHSYMACLIQWRCMLQTRFYKRY